MNEEIESSPCVRSGLCCKTAICAYGEANEQGGCKHLLTKFKGDGYEFFECGRHDWIVHQPGAEWMPAFGAGCCMALANQLRYANMKALIEKKVDIREVVDHHWFKENNGR